MTWLQSQYNLDTSAEDGFECENFDGGQCLITIWKKKSAKELQKLQDQNAVATFYEPNDFKKQNNKESSEN